MTELYARLKRILFVVAAIVVLALPLMFVLEDFVRDAIVTPTAYFVWLAGVVIDALPDAYLLGFAVAMVAYIAARSLLREDESVGRRNVPHVPTEGAATIWLRKLELVTRGSYSEQRLDHHVGQLLLRVIAYENRCSLREAGQMVEEGEVELPPELQAYLQAAMNRRLPRTPNLWERLRALVQGLRRPKTTAHSVAKELEPALIYVEQELKIRPPEDESR